MRIRKRLLLSSSLPSELPTDLNLHQSETSSPSDHPPKLPSDQAMAIRTQKSIWASPNQDYNKEKKMKRKELGDDKKWRYDETSNDISTRRILSISDDKEDDTEHRIAQPSLSSVGLEGENKIVPLKKRKGCFERNPIASMKMKSKTNKKCGSEGASSGGGKKSKRGNVIREGSRCSRVNGRGWRCFQPTLVGYSLCEHHLGKGRLRSIRAPPLSDGGSPTLMVKVGVVKARSISSLLTQNIM